MALNVVSKPWRQTWGVRQIVRTVRICMRILCILCIEHFVSKYGRILLSCRQLAVVLRTDFPSQQRTVGSKLWRECQISYPSYELLRSPAYFHHSEPFWFGSSVSSPPFQLAHFAQDLLNITPPHSTDLNWWDVSTFTRQQIFHVNPKIFYIREYNAMLKWKIIIITVDF